MNKLYFSVQGLSVLPDLMFWPFPLFFKFDLFVFILLYLLIFLEGDLLNLYFLVFDGPKLVINNKFLLFVFGVNKIDLSFQFIDGI